MPPLEGGNLIRGNAEYLGRRGGVDVLPFAEGTLHGFVPGDVGQHPQLDLAVVRVHQHGALLRHEHLPDFRAQIRAHRDVLQIRLRGGQPPGGGHQILEGGVDPPVLPDLLDQPVCIGGLQLGQHPVVHDGGDNGMIPLQLLQNLRIGGVAGLGLFHRGQSQLFKEQLPQLLGGVDIEGFPGIGIDQRLAVLYPLRKHLPELHQLFPVDGHAPLFHPVQNPAQRQLDFVIKLLHTVLTKLLFQNFFQVPYRLRAGGSIPILHGRAQEGGGQLRNGIIRLGRVQVIGSERRIKYALPKGDSHPVQAVHGGLAVMEDQLLSGEGKSHPRLHGGHGAHALPAGKPQAAVGSKIQGVFLLILRHGLHPGQGLRRGLGGYGHLRLRTPQSVLVNQSDKFQLLEQLVELRPVVGLHNGIPGRKFNRCLRANGGQLVGQVGAFLPALQLFPELGPDGGILKMLIHPVQASEFLQQFPRGLGTHPGHAGDVVGGIPHQGLQVNQFLRLESVLCPEPFFIVHGRVGLAGLGDHQLHMDVFIDQLQTVPVAGDNDALPALFRADSPYGADHVIGLPALAFVDGDVHGPEHILHNGHLHGKLLGHSLPGGLVAVEAQMAEGGPMEVKGHAYRLGLLLLLHPLQNVQEAVDRMGVQSLPGGQGPHAEERPVDDAVSV